ncbi:MAG: DUF4230 domain-containing protein [Bacteroidota bacterium]
MIERIEEPKELYQSTLLTKVEQMGKLELAKYSFQEVTEVKRVGDIVDLRFFKYKIAPDSKAVLISQGSATGCIDLSRIKPEDLSEKNDTLVVLLPGPEMCYFKIDLEKSRLYDLQINYLPVDERSKFVQELYQAAEREIKKTALETGILEQTKENAKQVLRPLFESISKKKVIIRFKLDTDLAGPG